MSVTTSTSAIAPVYINGGFVHWSVTFQSSKKLDDPSFLEIYNKIISDKAYEILKSGLEKVTDKNEMGKDAKSFGMLEGFDGLKECGCEVLGRSPTNISRSYFENKVIEQILLVAKEKKLASIRITAFATGLLFGELVLLSKLIDKLDIDKKIELNCIDSKYETMEKNFERNYANNLEALSWKMDVNKAVDGFIRAVNCIINLASVKFSSSVELRFFQSVDDYIQHGNIDPTYKHDFLVGADRGDTDSLIERLVQAGTYIADAIFLERRKDNGTDCAFLHTIDRMHKSNLEKLS